MEEKSRANKLNRLATAAWLVISDSYAERLKSFFKDVERNRDLLNTVKTLPADYSAITAAYQYFIKSALLGISHTVEKKEFDDVPAVEEIEAMPFAEAVEYLKARTSISAEEYYQLSDKLKYKAFTVSRIADGDSIEKIKGRITKALEDGGGMKEFLQMQKDDVLNKVGLGSSNGYYWETVFRAGSQSAYNTGRMIGYNSDQPIALQFIGIEDSRQTDICHSLSNIIRPYGDPFWDSRIPPLHFGCRSTIRGIYDESEIPAEYPEAPEMKAADGWGFNPLKDNHWFEMFPEMEKRAENYGIIREIEFARKKLIVDKVSEPTKDELIQKAVRAIEQKRTEQMPEKIYGYNDMPPKEKQKAICNWLIRKGMMSGKERVFISSTDGKPVFIRLGDAASVSLEGTARRKLVAAEPDSLILFHNHPYSGSFSYADMQTLNKYESLKEILAVGHNGTVYSLRAAKRLRKEDLEEVFASVDTEPEVIKKLVKNYKWKYTVRTKR